MVAVNEKYENGNARYLILLGIPYFLWRKRGGQMHIDAADGKTYCGKPMLGNNYAEYRPVETRDDMCKKCNDMLYDSLKEGTADVE